MLGRPVKKDSDYTEKKYSEDEKVKFNHKIDLAGR